MHTIQFKILVTTEKNWVRHSNFNQLSSLDFVNIKNIVEKGTRVGPGYRTQTLAVKSRKQLKISFRKIIFLHIPASWAEI